MGVEERESRMDQNERSSEKMKDSSAELHPNSTGEQEPHQNCRCRADTSFSISVRRYKYTRSAPSQRLKAALSNELALLASCMA